MTWAQEVTPVKTHVHTEETLTLSDPTLGHPTRKELPDIETLAASMALEGQRYPVLRMPNGTILKGWRRIAAAKHLGWTTIKSRTVDTVEAAAEAITNQVDETSVYRYRLEELIDLAAIIQYLDRRDRPAKGASNYDTHVVVAPVLGMPIATYKRGRSLVRWARSQQGPANVVATAREQLAEYNAGRVTIYRAYSAVRRAQTDVAPPVEGLGEDGLPLIPPPNKDARSPKARQLRIAWIRAMAAKGADSAQISEKIGISRSGLNKIAQDSGIVITADRVLNRAQRKVADPNKVVAVAVDDLAALVWSLDKVDTDRLNPAEAAEQARQLKEYARAIEKVARHIMRGLK